MKLSNESIKLRVDIELAKIRKCKAKYDKQILNIKKKINKIRTYCTHDVKTYHPDDSGNNDSYFICYICGEELGI